MLRGPLAVALVVAGVSFPVFAQRGGARGVSGGRGGGPVMSSAPAFRGGFAPAARPSMIAAPQYRSSRPMNVSPSFRAPVRRPEPAHLNRRPVRAEDYRYRRTYVPFYGVGLPYNVGWLGPDFLDSGSYNDSSYAPAPAPAPPADAEYGATAPYPQPPTEQAEVAPNPVFRPVYQRPLPEPAAEDAVTLVFKDGRPSEQIHNYLLTRTTLFVQDQRRREIAVTDLDLTATEKVNHDAGIDFQLPAGSK